MIRVEAQAEPPIFDERVRARGREFLNRTPQPSAKQWRTHSYWREVLGELHDAYDGICAYSCHWIPFDTGFDTVEHFRPKDRYPRKAYEWSNYRLVCGTLNGRKGTNEGVLDPFKLRNGWFVIEFPSLLVKPSTTLSAKQRAQVSYTIQQLGLNDEATCLRNRLHYVKCFCQGRVTLDHLVHEAPFLAREIRRQRIIQTLPSMMGFQAAS